jgi:hypothetical protein
MDVLTGFASSLSSDKDGDCLVQLLEHLGHQRFQRARRQLIFRPSPRDREGNPRHPYIGDDQVDCLTLEVLPSFRCSWGFADLARRVGEMTRTRSK